MSDLLTGLAIAMVIEGLLWALATDSARRMVAEIAAMPDSTIKTAGWAFVAAGAALVWVIRG